MLYTRRAFTVPASSSTGPENCAHEWLDPRGRCVLCGQPSKAATVESFAKMRRARRADAAPVEALNE